MLVSDITEKKLNFQMNLSKILRKHLTIV